MLLIYRTAVGIELLWHREFKGVVSNTVCTNPKTCGEPSTCSGTPKYTVVSRKRAHYGLSTHPPSFTMISFWGLKLTWKSAHPAHSTGNREFPVVWHALGCVYTHHRKLQITQLHRSLHYNIIYSSRCLALDVTHYLHCFTHLVLMPWMLAHVPPCLSLM